VDPDRDLVSGPCALEVDAKAAVLKLAEQDR
jgi:hypothetical protein